MQSLTAHLLEADLPDAVLQRALAQPAVAWDIETTGLDWKTSSIETCQLSIADELFVIQLRGNVAPVNLRWLLADPDVLKIFHHAPFDVRFMTAKWSANVANVACTKIAAKIISPGLPADAYSLKSTLLANLGVDVDKTERLSDWSQRRLSEAQVAYAASDVAHLHALFDQLQERGRSLGVWHLVERSFEYIPTRAALDISGAGDVFSY